MFKAFEDNDREAIEALIADEFAFTSPFDNRIDRETYFERCWPNAEVAESFEIVFAAADGNGAVITYGAATTEGHSFRNTELFTVVGGHFGWDLPHEAEEGGWVDEDEGIPVRVGEAPHDAGAANYPNVYTPASAVRSGYTVTVALHQLAHSVGLTLV